MYTVVQCVARHFQVTELFAMIRDATRESLKEGDDVDVTDASTLSHHVMMTQLFEVLYLGKVSPHDGRTSPISTYCLADDFLRVFCRTDAAHTGFNRCPLYTGFTVHVLLAHTTVYNITG